MSDYRPPPQDPSYSGNGYRHRPEKMANPDFHPYDPESGEDIDPATGEPIRDRAADEEPCAAQVARDELVQLYPHGLPMWPIPEHLHETATALLQMGCSPVQALAMILAHLDLEGNLDKVLVPMLPGRDTWHPLQREREGQVFALLAVAIWRLCTRL